MSVLFLQPWGFRNPSHYLRLGSKNLCQMSLYLSGPFVKKKKKCIIVCLYVIMKGMYISQHTTEVRQLGCRVRV